MKANAVLIAATACLLSAVLFSVFSFTNLIASDHYISPIASDAFARELDKKYPSPTITPTVTPLPTVTPQPTPTPTTPTPTPTPINTSLDLEQLFSKYSSQFGIDNELLKRIARCESGLNSQAINGDYAGMFQFSRTSWESTRIHMGETADPNLRLHPEESIKTAAFKISQNGSSAWASCD